MAEKLFITNERMLDLMAWAIKNELVAHETEFFEHIGFVRTNIGNIRAGRLSFTKEQIRAACEFTGASADYIFGFTTSIKRNRSKKAMDMLNEAVAAVKMELKAK